MREFSFYLSFLKGQRQSGKLYEKKQKRRIIMDNEK